MRGKRTQSWWGHSSSPAGTWSLPGCWLKLLHILPILFWYCGREANERARSSPGAAAWWSNSRQGAAPGYAAPADSNNKERERKPSKSRTHRNRSGVPLLTKVTGRAARRRAVRRRVACKVAGDWERARTMCVFMQGSVCTSGKICTWSYEYASVDRRKPFALKVSSEGFAL